MKKLTTVVLASLLALAVVGRADEPVTQGAGANAGAYVSALSTSPIRTRSTSVDLDTFSGAYVHSSGTAGTSLLIEWSHDNSTWTPGGGFEHGNNFFPRKARYVRFAGKGLTTGTISVSYALATGEVVDTSGGGGGAPVDTTITANLTDFATETTLAAIKTAAEGTGASAQQVQGTAADGAAVVGNAVRVGGQDSSGNAATLGVGGSGIPFMGFNTVGADGVLANDGMQLMDNSETGRQVEVRSYLFNGATYDRQRGDVANGQDVDVTRLPGTVATDINTISLTNTNIDVSLNNIEADVNAMLADLTNGDQLVQQVADDGSTAVVSTTQSSTPSIYNNAAPSYEGFINATGGAKVTMDVVITEFPSNHVLPAVTFTSGVFGTSYWFLTPAAQSELTISNAMSNQDLEYHISETPVPDPDAINKNLLLPPGQILVIDNPGTYIHTQHATVGGAFRNPVLSYRYGAAFTGTSK